MTDETKLAFGHPEERAATTEGADFLDRISLRNHVVEVEIGAFQAERGVTQRLSFDVVVEVYPLEEDAGDDVDRILSYDRVTEAIAHELAAERLNLLETLSERIADRILLEPQAARVFVRIQKLDRGLGRAGGRDRAGAWRCFGGGCGRGKTASARGVPVAMPRPWCRKTLVAGSRRWGRMRR